MKKISFVLALVAGSFAASAQMSDRANAVKLNPLSLALMTGNVSYERAVSDNSSIQLGVFYSGVSISGLKYSGLGVTPEYRIYFGGQKQALNGVYAAPFLRYQNFSLTEKESNDKASFTSFGGGATIGWQKMWPSGFVLDLFAGPAYNSGKVKTDAEGEDFDIKAGIDGFGVRTGLTIGFGF